MPPSPPALRQRAFSPPSFLAHRGVKADRLIPGSVGNLTASTLLDSDGLKNRPVEVWLDDRKLVTAHCLEAIDIVSKGNGRAVVIAYRGSDGRKYTVTHPFKKSPFIKVKPVIVRPDISSSKNGSKETDLHKAPFQEFSNISPRDYTSIQESLFRLGNCPRNSLEKALASRKRYSDQPLLITHTLKDKARVIAIESLRKIALPLGSTNKIELTDGDGSKSIIDLDLGGSINIERAELTEVQRIKQENLKASDEISEENIQQQLQEWKDQQVKRQNKDSSKILGTEFALFRMTPEEIESLVKKLNSSLFGQKVNLFVDGEKYGLKSFRFDRLSFIEHNHDYIDCYDDTGKIAACLDNTQAIRFELA